MDIELMFNGRQDARFDFSIKKKKKIEKKYMNKKVQKRASLQFSDILHLTVPFWVKIC